MTAVPQYMVALSAAQEIKRERIQIRKAVLADRMSVAAALAEPACANMRVVEILAWPRWWGEYKAERFLVENGICSPFAVAGRLTDRQRAMVATRLRLMERGLT